MVGVAILALIGISALVYWSLRGDHGGPAKDGVGAEYTQADVDPQGRGGEVMRHSGPAHMKAVTSVSEAIAPGLSDPTGAGWEKVESQTHFPMPVAFRLGPKGKVQLRPTGGYVVNLDGDGEIVIDEARADAEKKRHLIRFVVKRGLLRVKAHDSDPSLHFTEIRTPKAQVLIEQGEVGLRIHNDAGDGQVWLISGKGTVRHADGRTQELPLKVVQIL
jgi:hypothetical protein